MRGYSRPAGVSRVRPAGENAGSFEVFGVRTSDRPGDAREMLLVLNLLENSGLMSGNRWISRRRGTLLRAYVEPHRTGARIFKEIGGPVGGVESEAENWFRDKLLDWLGEANECSANGLTRMST